MFFSRVRARVACGLALGMVSVFACAPLEGSSRLREIKLPREIPSGSPDLYEAYDQGLVVPPDRALVSVGLTARGGDAPAMLAAVQSEIERVKTAAKAGGCSASVEQYLPLRRMGDIEWRAEAQLRVELDLREVGEVSARMRALDTCMVALASLTNGEFSGFQVSEPLFSIDDPDGYAVELWRRHAERLARVAQPTPAPQLRPQDLRCASNGVVSVRARSIVGLLLALDLECHMGEESDVQAAVEGP